MSMRRTARLLNMSFAAAQRVSQVGRIIVLRGYRGLKHDGYDDAEAKIGASGGPPARERLRQSLLRAARSLLRRQLLVVK